MVSSREAQVRRGEDAEADMPAGVMLSEYDGTRRTTGRARRLVRSSDAIIDRIDQALNAPDAPEAKPLPGAEHGELLADEQFPKRILGAAAIEKATA